MRRDDDAFIPSIRRHPNVGEHHVRHLGIDRLQCLGEISTGADHLDRPAAGEHPADPLAQQEVVLGEHHPHRHRRFACPGSAAGVTAINCAG
jgi:hypothetical protein